MVFHIVGRTPAFGGGHVMSHSVLSRFGRGRRLRAVCAQLSRVFPTVLLVALAVIPLGFIIAQAFMLMRNIPMWDEFETVLQFLLQYRAAESALEVLQPFFSMANEHCMVTSRVIVVLLYELTGRIDFIHLAIVGDLFIVAVVVMFAVHRPNRQERLVALALASLLLFNLQHHENFFSSYASIDHFLVVVLTTATLMLVQHGGRAALVTAGLFATMAVFTLAQGLAVLVSAALLLALQSRWRQLAAWLLFSSALAAVFGWKLASVPLTLASGSSFAGVEKTAVYALTLLGGVPAVGNAGLASVLGVILLAGLAWLCWKRSWRREPFLTAMAVTAVLSAALIAYGRAGAPDVSPLSSRYMVQSAVAWIAVLMLLLKSAPSPAAFVRGAWVVLALAATLNFLSSAHFEAPARAFVQRRIDASRHYDYARTMVGGTSKIFPEGKRADAILSAAARDGVYFLRARKAVEVEIDAPLKEHQLQYYVDQIAVGPQSVHLKGWMFAETHSSDDVVPHVMLKAGQRSYFFRGRRERRPDVAEAMNRDEALESGFYFVIPKKMLPADEFKVALVLKDGDDVLYSNTDHRVLIRP